MAQQPLAVKYRPVDFDDLTEQTSIKTILTHQLETGTIKNAYLFCGCAGCGKTTTARILASRINNGKGVPYELDAASHNSVDDIRKILEQARTQAIGVDYKVYILDEAHSLSSSAWQALLKTLEEPPAKTVFIFCTTDPQKIPKTILSRVQRYDFQRISQKGIVKRLDTIMAKEYPEYTPPIEALEYIAKVADGGMRDAITILDKCLAYSTELTIENVVATLGTTDYDVMFKLTESIWRHDGADIVRVIDQVYSEGKDLKLFVKNFLEFVLDLQIYSCTKSFDYIKIPPMYVDNMERIQDGQWAQVKGYLAELINLNASIKWETNPKMLIQASLIVMTKE